MSEKTAVRTREKWVDDVKVIACIAGLYICYALGGKSREQIWKKYTCQKYVSEVVDVIRDRGYKA